MKKIFIAFAAISLSLTVAPAADIAPLLAPFPAPDTASLKKADADFIAAGPQAVTAACQMLLPHQPAKDLKVRYALNGAARYVARPGAEQERMMFSTALCEVLPQLTSPEAKRFVIDLLELCGSDEAVPALTPFINDKELAQPAIRALSGIGTIKALEALSTALDTTSDTTRIELIHALGADRFIPAEQKLLQIAAQKNQPATSEAALDALSYIGSAQAAKPLYAAASRADETNFSHAVTRYQRLGERLLQQGRKQQAADIFHKTISIAIDRRSSISPRLYSAICSAAADGLVRAEGKQSAETLALLAKTADTPLLHKLADLAEKLDNYTEVYAVLENRDNYFRYRRLAIEARHGNGTSLRQLLNELLTNGSDRQSIYSLLRGLDPAAVTATLLQLCGDSTAVQQAVSLAEEMPSEILLPAIREKWAKASPAQMKAFLEIISARQADSFVDRIIALLNSGDSGVRSAAISTLGSLNSPAVAAKLATVYKAAAPGTERKKALRIIARYCRDTGDISPLTALMQSPESYKEILPLLASISTPQALAKVTALQNNPDPVIRDSAFRALVKWRDPAAVPDLLQAAEQTKELRNNVLATGAAIRLASRETPADALDHLLKAHTIAKRGEEKTAAVSAIYRILIDSGFDKKAYSTAADTANRALTLLSDTQRDEIKNKLGL